MTCTSLRLKISHSTAQHSTAQHSTARNILLVTFQYAGSLNYGNRLQNYALQEVLKSLGFRVDNLCADCFANNHDFVFYKKKIVVELKNIVKRLLAALGVKKYVKWLKDVRAQPLRTLKHEKFRARPFYVFDDKYIDGKIFFEGHEVFAQDKSYWDKYDYAVTGSDVVWVVKDDALKYFYLTFMPEAKRVCYAPSFYDRNMKNIKADGLYEIHKNSLLAFRKLCCRESNGCELIKEISGRDALHVLDPTLLLTADYYRKIAVKPKYNVPEHFVLLYMIGGSSKENECVIQHFKKSLPIIDICNPDDLERYLTAPDEFLWLMDHADFVLTDSFHGHAFCVIFKKKFISFTKRGDTSNRIGSLLSALGITNRVYNKDGKIPEGEIDYDSVYEKLDAMREISLNYLKECLNVKSS